MPLQVCWTFKIVATCPYNIVVNCTQIRSYSVRDEKKGVCVEIMAKNHEAQRGAPVQLNAPFRIQNLLSFENC